MFYPYRTTTEKLADAQTHICESGDVVLSVHYQGGRDWVIVAHKGPIQGFDLAADGLSALIASAVEQGVSAALKKAEARSAKTTLRAIR